MLHLAAVCDSPMTKEWLPAVRADEGGPRGRPSPNHWIDILPGDAYALADEDRRPEDDPTILKDGDVVEFCWGADLGAVELTLHSDGSWTLKSDLPEPEEGILRMWVPFDYETISSSIEEMVQAMVECGYDPDTYRVQCQANSDALHRFMFRSGRFLPAEVGHG